MKKNFMTGLAILLPLVLTIIITMLLVNILTKPFQGLINDLIGRHNLQLLGSPEAFVILSKFIILILLGIALTFIGMLARLFFIKSFFKWSDRLVERIPLVSKIYKSLRDVMRNVFHEESTSFSKVVLVHFPRQRTWCIGFVTADTLPAGTDAAYNDRISVFVPATPNPTMGFMLLYDRKDVVFTDMSIDDAIRFIVSCGVMYSGFTRTSS